MQNVLLASDASALVPTVVNWLVESGLDGSDMPELLAGLGRRLNAGGVAVDRAGCAILTLHPQIVSRSEEHTSELQSHLNIVCRLLLEKKKKLANIARLTI